MTGAAVLLPFLLLFVILMGPAARLMASPPVAGLDPEKPPGANFDLSHWYLGTPELPISGSVEAADLINGFTSPWFFTGPDGAMVFWAPVTGGTTPNSTFPRSELREQINPPDNTINWGPAGIHILNGQCKVTVLPSTGKIIIGQIHSYLFEARPLLKLVFDNGTIDAQLKESPTADSDIHYTFPNVPFNSLITYRIVYADGMLLMTINGVTRTANVFANDPEWATEEHYFKAGSYVQDNSGPGTEIGRVEFYHLSASHVGPARLPTILKQPASLGAQLRSDIVLSLSAVGGLPLSYQWWKNGVLVPNATNSFLPLYNAQLPDSGAYHAVVTNGTGMITSMVGMVTVVTNTTPPTLGEALDATNLVWTTTGATAWTGNFGVAHDALDAARSPATAHGQSSALQTTVSGPGLLTWWWKVSSETNADYLIFDNNGLEQARISGEVAWQKRSITVPAGTQVLNWTYAKNSAVSDGGDRGLVDEVTFQPLPVAITTQPASQTVDAGATVLLNVVATGMPPLSYQWRLNDIDLANNGNVRGVTTSSLNLSNVTSLQHGNYSVVVSNATSRTVSSNALVIVNAIVPLNEALDATNLVWITNGPASWAGRPFGAHDGIDAAQTRPLSNSQSAALQTTLTGPGTVTFWWKVSSETNADNLIFDIGGTEQARISGEAGWQERTFAVAAGSRVLRWTYARNASGAAGLDTAWLDEVQFRPQPPAITAQPQGRSVDAFSTVTFTVTNTGAPPFSYQWRLNETNLVDGNGIRGSTATTLILSNVQVAQSGNYSVAIRNPTASVTSSNALLIVSPILSLAEALNTTNLVWVTNGTPPWVGRPTVSHDGRGAASSGALAHGVTGSFQTTVTGPGTVGFWWKVSSQPSSDRLMFYINGTELLRISGEIDWEQRTFPVPAGSQILSWSYRKNSSISEGQDRGWVDEVVYEPFRPPALPGNFSATAMSMTQINLAWSDNSTNETAFRLERSTNGTTFTQIALLASNVTSYANTGLVGGLTFFYRLSATNVAGRSAYTTQAVASTPWFNAARINFQPASAPVPPGYFPDAGLAYGDRGNGLVHGFTASRSSSTADRNSALSPDQRYDTYVSAGTSVSRFWEIMVPNGAYNVLLVAGDAGSTSGTYRFSLEGAPFLNGTASSTNRWITARATTVVTDGRLSLGNVSGATDNKLCFVEISRPGPLLTCQPDKMVEAGSAWTFNPPVETTNLCGGALTMIVVNTVTNRAEACGDTFTATRVWRSTDSCGNSNLCTQIVKLIDTTPPIIVPPGPQAVEAGTPWTFGEPMAFDLFAAGPVAMAIVNTTTNRVGFCGGGFAATRIWSATDACGNSMLGTQTVSVTDSMLPTLLCAASRTIEAGIPWDFDVPGAPVDLGEGTNIALVLVSTVTNRDDFCTGSYNAIRTWRATDGCGNSSMCSQVIKVADTTPPVLVCATNRTVEAGSSWSFDLPSALVDAGDGTNVTLLLLATVTNRTGFCDGSFLATRTWSAIDGCGNSNDCSQSILVQDTTPPALVCAADRFVETGIDWTFDPPADPVDAGGTNITLVLVSTLTNYSGFCEGSYSATRTWLAIDPCGNSNTCSQVIFVVDTTPPELVCAHNKTVEAGTDWMFDRPALAADAGSGTNLVLISVSTVTNFGSMCEQAFSITRTWAVRDGCGNSNTCAQSVTVLDTTPPTLDCIPGQSVESGLPWDFLAPTAIDLVEGTNVTMVILSTVTNVLCGNDYAVTRIWAAGDACGNSNTCSQTITVTDTVPPAVTPPLPRTIPCGATWTFDLPEAIDANDGTNVTIRIVSTRVDALGGDAFAFTRTWAVVDICGNSNGCTQVITVADTTAPTLLCMDTNTSDPCFQILPVAVDACDPAPQLACVRQDGQPMGALFPAGATVVTCAAQDRSSNAVTCQFVVTLTPGPAVEDLGNRIVCANSDVTFQATAPWSAPSVYVWKFAGAIVPNAHTPTLVLSNVTMGNAGSYCVEITGPCQSVTNCGTLGITNCLPSELCTLTPGFYANPQARWNGFVSQALLTNLISSSPLQLGHPGVRSVVIGLEDIPNLVPRLPARGAAAPLPDNGDQRIATQPRNNKGRLDNALLGHAITLTLNTRLDNALGGFTLNNRFCSGNGAGARSFEIPAPVLAALADPGLAINNATVDGLLTLAQAALAGAPTGPATLSNITAALEAINLAFEGCRTISECEAATPLLPPNDAFANRLSIPTIAGQNTVVVSGWNVGATAEPGEPRHGFPATKSVWWQWRPAQSGWVTIRMTGSSFDTLLSVYTGDTLDQLTPSASSDDVNNLLSAEVVFFASNEMEYKFAVDGYDGDGGNIVLTIYKGILP